MKAFDITIRIDYNFKMYVYNKKQIKGELNYEQW